MTDEREIDDLWERFHQVVNMSSAELVDWLGTRTEDAPGSGEPVARQPGGLGAAVVSVLRKSRRGVTRGDVEVMRAVVALVVRESAGGIDGNSTDGTSTGGTARPSEPRLYQLRSVGHDPSRASDPAPSPRSYEEDRTGSRSPRTHRSVNRPDP